MLVLMAFFITIQITKFGWQEKLTTLENYLMPLLMRGKIHFYELRESAIACLPQ